MKIAYILLLYILFPLWGIAQNDVTQFLGIPIDGTKSEMIYKLKSKGFTVDKDYNDILNGEFNGRNVNIHIGTNNNKVYRILVSDASLSDEASIKIRFNNLIRQFNNSKKYRSLSDSVLNEYIIPDKEDIGYEILVNKKRYSASFFQEVANPDTITLESFFNSFNKNVWFYIESLKGKYYINIFYDNLINAPKGDDL
jgi:hypothetical protein